MNGVFGSTPQTSESAFMPQILRILVLLLLVLANAFSQSCFAKEPSESKHAKKPNIVFLLADDLGWTGTGSFGSDFYETPNLDGMVKDGIKFTNAYAACTVCSPTRASIMTGMYPARLRCTDFIAGQNRSKAKLKIPDWTKRLESRHVTIAEALKEDGYRTAHVGKWHLNSPTSRKTPDGTDALSQGFDVSIQKPDGTKGYFLRSGKAKAKEGYVTDWLTDQACEFIAKSAEADEPFFLYFAYHTPHTPIQGRPDLVEKFRGKVDAKAIHRNPTYAAMVASLDQSVGRVLDALKSSGIEENTIVIFTSDNGGLTQRYGVHDNFTENLPLRRGKGSAYEGGVRVPAIVKWPSNLPAGAQSDTPIITIDYYPTLLALSGARGNEKHSVNVDGVNLLPVFKNPEHEFGRNLYWHYPHYHAGGDGPYSAIRQGDYRLIEFFEDDSLRLYDLAKDIGEESDLSRELPEKTASLHAELKSWRERIAAQLPSPNPNWDPNNDGSRRSK